MLTTTYELTNPIDGDVRTTELAAVAERYSRNGHRVTARTEAAA